MNEKGVVARKALVVGWFSVKDAGTTAGDLMARDLACDWLKEAGYACDVAVIPSLINAQPMHDSPAVSFLTDWHSADPRAYSVVVFVCGPFAHRLWESKFIAHFAGCRMVGLDLSMLTPLNEWNPFDFLLERHSSERAHPDIVFLSQTVTPPVVGVCLVENYEDALVPRANEAIRHLTESREMSVVNIDTRLEMNETGLRSPSEVEALIARMDVLITTRLHGIVLALKNGIPVLAIDPLGDGRKLLRQCQVVGWPIVFPANDLSQQRLAEALEYCLSDAAKVRAQACAHNAIKSVKEMRDCFVKAIGS